jgi:hypothetical protein
MSVRDVFKRGRAGEWTLERIGRMTARDIKQLRENAERLNEAGVAELCSEALKVRGRPPIEARARSSPRTRAQRLIARVRAFEARGVCLEDPRSSWGGVRKADGAIVLALWADAVLSADGTCRYLLWAPNVDGARPWSDKPAGRERLAHCKRAMELGRAEGLLVYGDALDGYIPEDKAYAVHGADAETVLEFEVQRLGEQYWAVWGKRAVPPT